MAGDNLEIVRSGYAAFTRGDFETAFSTFDPDIEAYDDPSALTHEVFRGIEGFGNMLAAVNEGFEEVEYRPDEFEELGDRVLVAVRRTGRGAKSGVPVEERQYHLWTMRDGRAVRFQLFFSKADAVRAAG